MFSMFGYFLGYHADLLLLLFFMQRKRYYIENVFNVNNPPSLTSSFIIGQNCNHGVREVAIANSTR